MNEFERAKFYGVTIEELRALEGIVEKYNGAKKSNVPVDEEANQLI